MAATTATTESTTDENSLDGIEIILIVFCAVTASIVLLIVVLKKLKQREEEAERRASGGPSRVQTSPKQRSLQLARDMREIGTSGGVATSTLEGLDYSSENRRVSANIEMGKTTMDHVEQNIFTRVMSRREFGNAQTEDALNDRKYERQEGGHFEG